MIAWARTKISAGMNGAEDMIVDHNMVVTQVFRRLGKRLDRPCIAAKFELRINLTPAFIVHFLFHDVRSCARYRPSTSGPEAAARTPAHNFGRDTVADYPAR
jgi:hypothetical protein